MQLEKTYDSNFSIQAVYGAWVSSNTVIPPATRMEVLPEVGGHYRLIMETPDFKGKNEGKFLAVDPGEHVIYRWEWNDDGEITSIEVTFSEINNGTQVGLKQSGFTKEKSVTHHDSGWDSDIEGFTAHLQSRTR